MPLSGSGAPPVVLVFGLEDPSVRWLTRQLRAAGVVGVRLRPDLPEGAAHAVVNAADAGVHMVSAAHGMDATFLDYWHLLAESGKARFVAVHDLLPTALDVNETAAIATRVLEEDVLPTTLPLLDDDEAVTGVLDAITGEQWFPGGDRQPPRSDFTEAVELETNTLYDEAALSGRSPQMAIQSGMLCPAISLDVRSGAGVQWLVEHLPERRIPEITTVLPADEPDVVLLAAGERSVGLGPVTAVFATGSSAAQVKSLVDVLGPGISDRLPPGAVAAASIDPVPAAGAYLVD